MRTSRRWRRALLLLPFGGMLLFFQNCGQMKPIVSGDQSSFDQAADCMANGSVDACIFLKSPAGQNGRVVTIDTIGGFQHFGVKLTGLGDGDYLENAEFSVLSVTEDTRLKRTQKYKHYYTPLNSYLEQVAAYYWINEGRTRMSTLGVNHISGKELKIIADSSFNGWVPSKNEIHLARSHSNFSAALDATVVLGLLTQAAAYHATLGTSDAAVSTKAVVCPDARKYPNPKGCCTDVTGCSPAIVSGAADYFAATFFSGSQLIGEGWKNDPAGLKVCGLARNPAAHASLTAPTAYTKCASRGSSGNVYAMGLVYASIWWEARKKATDKNDFDKLFLKHLSLITATDDFTTMRTKVLTLDTNEFSGRHGSNLSAQFDQRGL